MKLFESWHKQILQERFSQRYGEEASKQSQILQTLAGQARIIRVYHQGNFFDIMLDDGFVKVYHVRTKWEEPFIVKDAEQLLNLEKNWQIDRGFGSNAMVI